MPLEFREGTSVRRVVAATNHRARQEARRNISVAATQDMHGRQGWLRLSHRMRAAFDSGALLEAKAVAVDPYESRRTAAFISKNAAPLQAPPQGQSGPPRPETWKMQGKRTIRPGSAIDAAGIPSLWSATFNTPCQFGVIISDHWTCP